MKKLLAVFLVFGIIASMAGCGKNDAAADTNHAAETNAAADTGAEPELTPADCVDRLFASGDILLTLNRSGEGAQRS